MTRKREDSEDPSSSSEKNMFERIHWIYRQSGGYPCSYPKQELRHLKVIGETFGATDEEIARCRQYIISEDARQGVRFPVDLSRVAKIFDIWKMAGCPEKYEALDDRPGPPIRRM